MIFAALVMTNGAAQTAVDYAVRLNAKVDTAVPSVTLTWKKWASATSYTINKKAKDDTGWGTVLASLGGGDTTYTDLAVSVDTAYEYRVKGAGASISAYGYIFAGLKFPAREHRGMLVLLVDSAFTDTLAAEIKLLMDDLSGDGWALLRHDVSRDTTVTYVRSLIQADYNAYPGQVKALLILGHVPVPYSGDINPDGHPDHKGAWPADAVYADVNGNYTDVSVNDTVASRPENRNVPGDGKYDQSTISTNVELMTGRIDFAKMPAFGTTEVAMMRRYLQRNHDFRNALIRVPLAGLIDDNFGAFSGEAFAASAWKSFPPLVGDTSVQSADFFTTLGSDAHLWSYGCGGGSYTSASGIGNTTNFVNDSVQSLFTALFGSYFGDWDSQNNFLRAPLASRGLPLTCAWSGRPHWQFHHMAMGEPIGYSAKWAMNNSTTYFANYGARFVHIALMGDPSLRLEYIAPPQQVTAGSVYPIEISWLPSTDTVDGYYVYRSDSEYGVYERISPQPVTANVFYDNNPINGLNYYMVRAIAYAGGPSGCYVNISTGMKDTTFIDLTAITDVERDGFSVFPNPSDGIFFVHLMEPLSANAKLSILDLQGRLVYSRNLGNEAGHHDIRISTGINTPGVFLVKVASPGFTAYKRIQVVF